MPDGTHQLLIYDCMMEDSGEVKFTMGEYKTTAKLTVDINEAWRRMKAEQEALDAERERISKGGGSNYRYMPYRKKKQIGHLVSRA